MKQRAKFPEERIFRMRGVYVFLAALAVAFFVFGPSLRAPFVYDDFHQPFSDPATKDAPLSLWLGGVRPLLMSTFLLNYWISGTDPLPYHLVNLALHALCCVLGYLCAMELFALAKVRESERTLLALFAASVFLLHPLQTESVDYITSRSEILTGCFMLAALLFFLRSFREKMSPLILLTVLGMSVAAMLSKEQAVALPALFILTDLLFGEGSVRVRLQLRARLYAVFALVSLVGIVLVLRELRSSTSAGFSLHGNSWLQYLVTECQVIPIYVRLFFLPYGQSIDWNYPIASSPFNILSIAGALSLLLLASGAYLVRRRFPLCAYGLFSFLLLLAPTSSFIPLADPLSEHRLYLPLFGLALALAGLLQALSITRKRLITVITCIALAAATLSWNRSHVWASDVTVWHDAAEKDAGNMRAGLGFGVALLRSGRCQQAADQFTSLAGKNPTIKLELLQNRASAFECAGRLQAALTDLSEIAGTKPDSEIYQHIGILMGKLGRAPEARLALDRAIELNSTSAQAFALRGAVRASEGESKAAEDLKRALQLDPTNQLAAQELARISASQ